VIEKIEQASFRSPEVGVQLAIKKSIHKAGEVLKERGFCPATLGRKRLIRSKPEWVLA
jgi:hypothetical protein